MVSNLKNFFSKYNGLIQIKFHSHPFRNFWLHTQRPREQYFCTMKNNCSIKEKIFEIRRKKGISQEEMAQMLGISNTSFRKLETGKTVLINHRLWDIAKILEITLEELMLEEDFNTGMSLSDIERQKFLKEIESLKSENSILKQRILILTEKYDGYVKKAK